MLEMRYIAAYLLLQLGGNSSPSASEIKQLLSVVGIEAEHDPFPGFKGKIFKNSLLRSPLS
ncbi:hypothetical protein F5879DRAFT_971107 [Lentinula edodes]|nr:uncharacterized protein C8R40DRAFT_745162 [Lentinula edodes]KAH7869290.1 hypothetical protein C8R40DRAFT_745162 [Lentinula edodes]KAJ3900779.1 hypothetical protein F5879DRAFT_971107 [Lentinula edodes]